MTNSTHLRDTGFPEELDKWWNREEFFDRCDIQCYQTAYKWEGKKYLGVFADEFDTSLTPKYSKFYWNNKWEYFMGLSGTLTEDQYETALQIAPMLFQYSVQQAQSDGLINKVEIFVHNVPLSWINTLDTGKGFVTSEVSNIKYWNKGVEELQDEINMQKEMIKQIQENGMYDNLSIVDVPELRRSLRGKNEHLKRKRMARARQFYNMPSLSVYALKLQGYLLGKYPEDKVIMFSKSTKIADSLGPSYHSKNKKEQNLIDFNNGTNRVLSVVKSVSRGISFVNLKHAITQSMDASATGFIQREIGRMVRANPDEIAKVHILNPVINDSKLGLVQLQPKVWIDKATKGFKYKEINIVDWW